MSIRTIKKILQARVYDVAEETPVDRARSLSRRLNNSVLLKREDLQPVFSFKIRGAYNKIANLSEEEKARGVICASAGNHAQGVALAAARLGIKAVIVMPQTTPEIKVNSVRTLGGKVVLHGDAYDQAAAKAKKLMDQHGYTFVHPFDDPDVIAGQGTVGMEILRQHTGDLEAVFVPVGGGGLIAGVATYIKYLRPEVKVIGVEPGDSNCLQVAMLAGRRVVLPEVGLFADGVAVKQIGKETFRLARKYVDEVITVSTDEMCAAIKDLFDDTRSINEPAGALAVAGLKKYVEREQCQGATLIAVCSGANVNFDRLRHVAERAEIGEQREAVLAVTIPERPGSFRRFCQTLGKRSITEFNYRYACNDAAHVYVGVQTAGPKERQAICDSLLEKGYQVQDFSQNEMAKLHIRHMVGGRGPATVADEKVLEVLYRFEFPERPGALMEFLSKLGQNWNISLFHYRNHGAAFGRILVGMQVPVREHQKLRRYVEGLGYRHWDESDNPAYQLFLK
ncbi:MAG: threonine ammonia-lyase, biosynthetic [Pseudomonadales bacterium]|jgi:threonine dehydratase|uniref:threonine ammonia-lyase, biosynthetic n=1 Tax=unclassified Ketobacter TaxID=2639109 RepID=UPI000C8FEEDF|nr:MULTISPECIES: threonine ammonia-lyase, biosynthetic [unclassified Ketobacter]MAA58596.1 threonine ammonia-lyase, biosynthetic [Pseudomonadales bacterium]MEC8811652.1 threonine ammonia-lyase, biosynthetic [Pseudomonadota bacterium]TNC86393.1 MAG: threonine ammonia-lyase, biosynthetic [Alcanivorax sp.]HAG92942.1 threonine ammonia-lyase, biosynthetic [Gammaproteobacteria bacterium]MAQ23017.1 threonine ammonia-lyase, biosynthetic [Pseudomonadales bacterium]|tara:strand:+ start:6643 stop:8169 length:1527 start_codon:yes stop_codon:yes gene_type:complete